MSDLQDLYQDLIRDHSKSPRNFRKIEGGAHAADGHNPLCGDKLTVYVAVNDGIVTDASFEGTGCAISTASASLMTDSLKGKSVSEAEELFRAFHEMLTGDPTEEPDPGELGKLAVFGGVRRFPVRVKCATLCWHTLHAALEQDGEPATTE